MQTPIRIATLLLFAVSLSTVSAGSNAAVLRVKSDAPGPAHDGITWATAYLSVSDALGASHAGDEVWVAKGTCPERLMLKAGVGLYGGFTGTETQRDERDLSRNVTTIQPEGHTGPPYYGAVGGSAVTVAAGSGLDTVLDGFTITGGGNASNANGAIVSGGGIRCEGASPTIRNNTITGNSATGYTSSATGTTYWTGDGYGGGIYLKDSGALVIDNTVADNAAWTAGGGIACVGGSPTIRGNVIASNQAYLDVYSHWGDTTFHEFSGDAGGIYCAGSRALVEGNTVERNTCVRKGGGLMVDGLAVVRNNAVRQNKALGTPNTFPGASPDPCSSGGGIYADGAVISRNIVETNQSATDGGGLFLLGLAEARDNLIVGNSAGVEGAGVRGGAVVQNNTVAGNGPASAASTAPGALVVNNVVAYNSSGYYQASGPWATFVCNSVYSNGGADFTGGLPSQVGQNGNIIQNPLFANRDGGDYHLTNGSRCIDAGDDSVVAAGDMDLDGRLRKLGAHVDMGAYEYPAAGLYTMPDAIRALKIAAGLEASAVAEPIPVGLSDALTILRKVTGLKPNL